MSRDAAARRFATVVFDVDSTLSGVEGIAWLAGRRDAAVSAEVRRLTDDAMGGRLALEDAYARRLELIAPTRDEVAALALAYLADVAPGAGAAIARLRRAGVRVLAISGGACAAVLPLTRSLGFADADVFAVAVRWDEHGRYADFDRASPLATQTGKADVVRAASPAHPVLAVGDGSTDAAMKAPGAADAFAAYAGFARRDAVIAVADYVVESLAAVVSLVLPDDAPPAS